MNANLQNDDQANRTGASARRLSGPQPSRYPFENRTESPKGRAHDRRDGRGQERARLIARRGLNG